MTDLTSSSPNRPEPVVRRLETACGQSGSIVVSQAQVEGVVAAAVVVPSAAAALAWGLGCRRQAGERTDSL